MRKLSGYEKAQAYSDTERLPVGGYVLKIMDVKYQENSWGDVILLSFDIAEGEQKDFFSANWKAQTGEDKKWKGTYRLHVPKDDGSEQDNWTMRRFKTVMGAFEDNSKNNRHGFFTNCHSLVTVEKICSGKFEIPADTLLKENRQQNSGYGKPDADGFMNIPDGIDEELPF